MGGHGLVLSSTGEGRRLDGGLRSIAEVAASIFQSEKWEGMGLQKKRLDKVPALRALLMIVGYFVLSQLMERGKRGVASTVDVA